MSFSAIKPHLISLIFTATSTIALTSGAILSYAVTILLCKALRRLEKRIYSESSASEDGKSSAHSRSELEKIASAIALLAYAVCCAIALPTSDTAITVALEASVMVIGVSVGLAVTVLILMVLLKMVDCFVTHEQQSEAPQDRKDENRQQAGLLNVF